jgi:hypothetical protein
VPNRPMFTPMVTAAARGRSLSNREPEHELYFDAVSPERRPRDMRRRPCRR